MKANVIELWSGNFEAQLKDHEDLPWLVSYCGESGGTVNVVIFSWRKFQENVD